MDKFIETYRYDEEGYLPVMIREGWQVAKLNWLPGHSMDEIDDVEAHNDTDEVFILLSGTAVLIAADFESETGKFYTVNMTPYVIYNIPKGVWHNIAMEKGTEMIIVEKSNTHVNDCVHRALTSGETSALKDQIMSELK